MEQPKPALRRGWTTGACAAASARAAYTALITGAFPDPVEIALPNGARVAFALACSTLTAGMAQAGIVKDAGDDPDVTHGALILVSVTSAPPGSGIIFRAGPGVGTITLPGLPLPPGEPAINPVPRAMIRAAITEAAALHGGGNDLIVEISVPDGIKLAERTLNGRLGIVGGLSILGTTGIVVPYSCAAWIDSIHRGIDVARATGLIHVAGSTGSMSEGAIAAFYSLPNSALIEMGDFVGGMLKYLRRRPVQRVTIAGGPAKLCKLGQGMLDLHSKRGEVDLDWLAAQASLAGASGDLAGRIAGANTALAAFGDAAQANFDLAEAVLRPAWQTAADALKGSGIVLDVVMFGRDGTLLGRSPVRDTH